MKKSTVIIIIALVAVLGLVSVAIVSTRSTTTSNTASDNASQNETNSDSLKFGKKDKTLQDLTSQSEVTMDIKDFAFEKQNIRIKKGTKVTWTNQDSAKHTVTSDGPGAEKLDSKLLAKGESFSYTFNIVGNTPYLCTPHPYMKASVTVVE